LFQLTVYNIPIGLAALTLVSWVILFALMKLGFRQVIRVVKEA
jgi:hypothetical protein